MVCWTRDSFTIFGLWVLGIALSHINESQLQTYESIFTIFHDKSAIPLHPGTRWNTNFESQRKNYEQKMQDAQVKKKDWCSWNHEYFMSLPNLMWSPFGLHLLCKRPEVFRIPWTYQKLISFLKYEKVSCISPNYMSVFYWFFKKKSKNNLHNYGQIFEGQVL